MERSHSCSTVGTMGLRWRLRSLTTLHICPRHCDKVWSGARRPIGNADRAPVRLVRPGLMTFVLAFWGLAADSPWSDFGRLCATRPGTCGSRSGPAWRVWRPSSVRSGVFYFRFVRAVSELYVTSLRDSHGLSVTSTSFFEGIGPGAAKGRHLTVTQALVPSPIAQRLPVTSNPGATLLFSRGRWGTTRLRGRRRQSRAPEGPAR